MKAGTALYLNSTDARIELAIGSRPGVPWTRYDADPGQAVEGPAAPAYMEKFMRAGFVVATKEEAEIARMLADEAKDTVAAEPTPVAKVEDVDVPPAAPLPQKGRRADRSSKS